MNRTKLGGLIKKTAAVVLSMVMAFGAVSVLPSMVVKDNAVVASAEKDRTDFMSIEANDCTFYFSFTERTGSKTVAMEDADINNADGTMEMPSTVTYEGVQYTVTDLANDFLNGNKDVKNAVIPDTVTYIGNNVFKESSVVDLKLSDNLEHLGDHFAADSRSLKNVDSKTTKITPSEMGKYCFMNCYVGNYAPDAICVGNWLLRYAPYSKYSAKESTVKVADVAPNGVKIEYVGGSATITGSVTEDICTVDLEGIKYVGEYSFSGYRKLIEVLHYDEVDQIEERAFRSTPWMENGMKNPDGYAAAAGSNTVIYKLVEKNGKTTAMITSVYIYNKDGVLEIPDTITAGNEKYTVSDIADDFLNGNQTVKSVVFPFQVTSIGDNVLANSTVESISIPNGLKKLGTSFASDCPNLKYDNVIYEGIKIEYVDASVFSNSPGMKNDKDAVCLSNWLINYSPTMTDTVVSVTDLANGDCVIDSITDNAVISANPNITTLDLDRVEFIGSNNFTNCPNLTEIKNDSDVEEVGERSFDGSEWYETEKGKGIAKLGSVLLYYKNQNNVINLTSDVFSGIKSIRKGAFADCTNVDTLICTSSHKLSAGCLNTGENSGNTKPHDPLPAVSTSTIKNIIVDGKKLEFSKSSPVMPEWVSQNYAALEGTEWVKVNAEAKMKALFEQLGMEYYGTSNDKIGKLTKKEEFYNTLKAHEYISTYDPNENNAYSSAVEAFLCGGKLSDKNYAELMHYLNECAGVDYRTLNSRTHKWNAAKIGDEWFEVDAGLDQQNGHGYGWFALSAAGVSAFDDANGSQDHEFTSCAYKWHAFDGNFTSIIRPGAKRILGDLNSDGVRDQTDVDLLWENINGKGSVDKALGDINFDGKVDVTDGVLLDAFVNHTSVDPQKYSKDGMSPGFNVTFVNGKDYGSIKYEMTDNDGYIVLPKSTAYKAPNGKVFDGWNIGKAGEKVKISDPYTVIMPVWKNEVKGKLGDVDGSGTIDISDVSKLINHINGVKALDDEEFLRADVNKSKTVDISDASAIVNHINGVKAIEGTV